MINVTMPSSKPRRSVKVRLSARRTRPSEAPMTHAVCASKRSLHQRRSRRALRNILNLSLPSSSTIAMHRHLRLPRPLFLHSRSSLLPRQSPQLHNKHLIRAPSPYRSHPRLLSQPQNLPPRLHQTFLRRLRALLLNLRQVSQVRLLSRPCPLLSLQLLLPRQSR